MALRAAEKRTPRSTLARCVVALEMLLMAACAAGGHAADRATQAPSLEALIGDAACDSDSQCHTIGVGSKACGGFERFLAWSSLQTDRAALESAATRASGVERTMSQAPRTMSNCAVVIDPGAYCSIGGGARASNGSAQGTVAKGRCRLRSANSVSVADMDPTHHP